ncbi:hypothetical protein [Kitasatospora sp. NPDC001175]|uniref:hypothetical protein n=1 Tax=Kitasatospora sp. NPDC001175 TaxID=3157103 RepID=UPI003D06D694
MPSSSFLLQKEDKVGHIDPASKIRPDWWSDQTYLHLRDLDDGLNERWRRTGWAATSSLLAAKRLAQAFWYLGKTGGWPTPDPSGWLVDHLRTAEYDAMQAGAEIRAMLSQCSDEDDNDLWESVERSCEKDPEMGPQVHVLQADVVLEVPSIGGDTIQLHLSIDTEGIMTADGNGSLSDLDLRSLLDLRAAMRIIEEVAKRSLERPALTEQASH